MQRYDDFLNLQTFCQYFHPITQLPQHQPLTVNRLRQMPHAISHNHLICNGLEKTLKLARHLQNMIIFANIFNGDVLVLTASDIGR